MRDITLGDTFYVLFTTRSFSTGAPAQLAGTPVISAYEDNSTTQITSGVSLGVDHDTVTGLNLITVVASGANGFESGKSYHLVITTGTVGGVSVVGEVVGEFTIQLSAAAVDLANGTDGLGAIKSDTAAILVDTAEIGTAGAGLTEAGGTGDQLTALATAAALATVDSNVDAILVDTAEIGAAGAGLSAIPWNASWDVEVQSEVNDGLVAFFTSAAALVDLVWDELQAGHTTAGTFGRYLDGQIAFLIGSPVANLATDIASVLSAVQGLNDLSAAAVNAEVDTAIADAALATAAALATVDSNVDAILVDTGSTLPGLIGTPSSDLAADIAAVLAAVQGLNDLSAAEVNAEVVDVLSTDTLAESSAVPAANASIAAKIAWLATLARNKIEQTSSTTTLYADDGSTSVATSSVANDGTTTTRGEWA